MSGRRLPAALAASAHTYLVYEAAQVNAYAAAVTDARPPGAGPREDAHTRCRPADPARPNARCRDADSGSTGNPRS